MKRFKKTNITSLVIIFAIVVALAVLFLVSKQWYASNVFDLGETTVDWSPADYRSETKRTTLLGSLPRPMSIISKEGVFYGVDQDNAWHAFELAKTIETDGYRQAYFDVFSDKLYYISDKTLHAYDLATHEDKVVQGEINEFLKTNACQGIVLLVKEKTCLQVELAGAHNNQIVLQIGSGAAAGWLRTYATDTGKEIKRAEFAGHDIARGFEFYHNEQILRLILNSKGSPESFPVMKLGGSNSGMYMRTTGTQMDVIEFYLEEEPDTDDLEIGTDFNGDYGHDLFSKWGDLVFTLGAAPRLDELTPFYIYDKGPLSNYSNSEDKFSLRNFYRIDEVRVAAEINGDLVVINVNEQDVDVVSDEQEIESLLENAVILFGDQSDFTWSVCGNNNVHTNYIYGLTTKKEYQYSFCLQ